MSNIVNKNTIPTLTTNGASSQNFTPQAHIPCATYRLQFNRAFTFRDAERLVSYLHTLGITDYYSSPYFKACTGTTHGYDIIDHNALNPELGSKEDYQEFTAALRRYNIGQILMSWLTMGIARGENPDGRMYGEWRAPYPLHF
jgi:maltooligosyltrehalose synthase